MKFSLEVGRFSHSPALWITPSHSHLWNRGQDEICPQLDQCSWGGLTYKTIKLTIKSDHSVKRKIQAFTYQEPPDRFRRAVNACSDILFAISSSFGVASPPASLRGLILARIAGDRAFECESLWPRRAWTVRLLGIRLWAPRSTATRSTSSPARRASQCLMSSSVFREALPIKFLLHAIDWTRVRTLTAWWSSPRQRPKSQGLKHETSVNTFNN